MVGLITPNDEAQLAQTIEMFEVITQSQPQDYQSLEILKEAYIKLGREQDALNTSKRIAHAYVLMGQISSAILEYESILQRYPEDREVTAALQDLEKRASNLSTETAPAEDKPQLKAHPAKKPNHGKVPGPDFDDGREAMHKLYVEGKVISAAAFEECWFKPDYTTPVLHPIEPFISRLADKSHNTLEKSLKLLSDKSRLGYLPLEKYDLDVELARSFPAEICRRWCILPFDRLSKCLMVATANPFNRQAAQEIEELKKQRILWYLSSPVDIIKALKKVYR